MFNDRKARLASFIFLAVAIVLPMLGLLIMNDQLTKANDITGSATIETASPQTQAFAGVLIIALVIVGLVSLLVKFRKNKEVTDVNAKIDDLSEKLKKL